MKTSTHETTSIVRSFLVAILVLLAPLQMTATNRGMDKTVKANVSLGSSGSSGADWASESQFTGNVNLSIPLASVGGVSLNLQYNSRVSSLVRSANSTSGSGWVGLGWTLSAGSIIGTIGSTKDTSDDHYQMVDAGGTSELVKGSSGKYLLRQHKVWDIRRVISSGTIVGWEIKTEDGTIMRYGNYDKSSGTWVFPSYAPTYATRCAIGDSGVVENPRYQDYSKVELIPTQWDLSDIQDPGGKHTTIIYQQRQASLSASGYSTAVSYTVESHPYKVQDDQGGEIECVFGTMNSQEYYADTSACFQTAYEKLFLDTLKIKRNAQVYQRINLKYASWDTLSVGARKRYLTEIDIYDRSGNVLRYGNFHYWGSGTVNPGALRRITYQAGGKQEFSYKSQRASSVTTNYTYVIPDSIKATLPTHPNASGVSGSDFLVVSSSLYTQGGNVSNWGEGWKNFASKPIRVFRFGPRGWYRDSSFPYDSSANAFVISDYVVGTFRGVWKAVKRVGSGWAVYDIDTALAKVAGSGVYGQLANRKDIAGFTPDYFVLKYNRSWTTVGTMFERSLCNLAVVRFRDDSLQVEPLGNHQFREVRQGTIDNSWYTTYMITAEGSPTYLIVTSVDAVADSLGHVQETHYKRINGRWKTLIDTMRVVTDPWQSGRRPGANFPSTPPRYAIGKNFVVCAYPEPARTDAKIRVYRITGVDTVTVDTARVDPNTQPVVGDDFYGITNAGEKIVPWFKQWNGSSFGSKVFLNSIFPSFGPSYCSWQRFSNRLMCMWQNDSVRTAVALRAANGNWSSPFIKEPVFLGFNGAPNGNPLFRILPVSGNSFVTVFDGTTNPPDPYQSGHMFWKLSSYSFIGDSLDVRLLRQTWWMNGNDPQAPVSDPSCSHTFQAGNNFFTSSWTNAPATYLMDTLRVVSRAADSLGYDSYGTDPFDIVVDKKYSISGMGDTVVTQYTFENGAFEESMTSGKYNKATVTLPGSAGKKTTYFYNDLDGTYAGEFISATNYTELDGRAYREKDSSSSGALVREQISQWLAEGIDLPNRGVFFVKQLRDSVAIDGVGKGTSYDYENASHLQVTKITETNSDGTMRVTKMKYPLDYSSTSSGSSDAMVRALDSMKSAIHIVNAVIEKVVIQDSLGVKKVLSGALTKYKGFGPGRILPEQQLVLRAAAGISEASFSYSSASTSSFSCDPNYSLQHTVDLYSTYGQVMQEVDALGVKTTTKWGYNSAVPLAVISNAGNNESTVCDFEDGTYGDWDDWTTGEISTFARTGARGWHHGSSYYGLVSRSFDGNQLDRTKGYKVSGWVKTNGTRPNLLWYVRWLESGRDTSTYPAAVFAQGTGNWQYIELPINLTPYSNIIQVMVFARNGQGAQQPFDECWWDDLRFAPASAVTSTTTYDTLSLLPTYKCDPAGSFSATGYDGFGRPVQVTNTQGALVKQYSYYYSADAHSGSFVAADPNYTREKSFRTSTDTTTVKSYTDGLGREIQRQICYGDSDIVVATKYDSLSRPRYAYKPYQVGLGGNKHTYRVDFADSLTPYYSRLGITLGNTPYAETRYCQDPLSRVQFQGAPGDAFAVGSGHEIAVSYLPDVTKKWNIVLTRNEQGDTTRLSKDLFGNTVRSVVRMGTADSLMTSFTYDAVGNLTKSTPPNQGAYGTSYQYNTLGQLGQKTSPDAGTSQYLYDKNGNIRLIRDAAHTGTGANAVNISASISPGGQVSSNITLNNRGKLNVTLNASGYPVMGGNVTLQVKTTGGVVLLSLVTTGAPQSGSLILPQGTYSYTVRSTAQDPPPIPYTIQCQTQYPFAYKKYDAIGRISEEGELEAADASGFTQSQADVATYPTSNCLLTKTFFYDSTSTDAMAAGQRNVSGRLSLARSYRLGTLALTTFYSYDDIGRIEWVVQKGLGSASKKISYAYDQQGNLTQKTYTDAYSSVNNFCGWYEYDQAGRPVRNYSGADLGTRISEGETRYVASGRESQLTLGAGPAQTLNYTYNQRDWTKSINSTQFWESLGYETVQEVGSTLSVAPQYSGNISWMAYSQTPDTFAVSTVKTTTIGYGFGYDKANRLTSANFGYKYSGSWTSHDRYKMPQIGYDKNGNITSLVRYGTPDGTSTSRMDSLSYKYLANTNRLDYIWDTVAAAIFPTDIDNQSTGAYAYDGNGNVKADASRGVALVVYDMNNLPVSEYLTNGTLIQYTYDASGMRVQKIVGAGSPVWYVGGADGKTEVVYNGSTSNPCYNLFGAGGGLIGQVKRSGTSLSRQYHLKDHLGTVRVTLSPSMIVENFGSDLSQWTTVLGSGFAIESGWLSASSAGSDNVMVNSSATTIADGVVACDVSTPIPLPSVADVSIVVRYVDTNNFYLIYPCGNRLKIFKKLAGTYALKVDVALPDGYMAQGTWYRMQTTLSGANIKVSWNGQQLINWTDPSSPLLSGKVGFRQDNSMHAHWDNFVAWSTGAPTILAYDDYYPFGQYMDYRSYNNGFADARYKYTEKERDSETGYDYFGARYYDARVGRWMSVDPSADVDPNLTPFAMCGNNTLRNLDPDGRTFIDYLKGITASVVAAVNPSYTPTPASSVSGDRKDYAVGRVVGDFVGAAIGVGEIQSGSAGIGGGATVALTGVGTVPGVIVAGGGVILAGHGILTTGAAVRNLGGDIRALMNENSSPTAGSQPYESNPQNEERMSKGKAPIGKDGNPVELHHEGQSGDGKVKEMTRTDHRLGNNFKANHSNTGAQGSKIDRSKFKQQREQYWKDKTKK